jgi:hypothetical protein
MNVSVNELKVSKMFQLKMTKGWKNFMVHYVVFDVIRNNYLGFAPDNELLAEHAEPEEFLKLYAIESNAWCEREIGEYEGEG